MKRENKEMGREAKKEVAKAKNKAYDELYDVLDTKEGENTLYRLARQRHQAGKDVQQRERRENDRERVNLEVERISKEEVRENMKRG